VVIIVKLNNMRIKIIKASNDKLWYSTLTFPVEFEVIKEYPHAYRLKKDNNSFGYVFKNDCEIINHTITVNNIKEEKATKFDSGKPSFSSIPQLALL